MKNSINYSIFSNSSLLENQSLNDNIKSGSNLFAAADVDASGSGVGDEVDDSSAVNAAKSSHVKFYPAQLDFREQ